MLDFDLHAQVQAARLIRQLFKTELFADMVGAETSPGRSAFAADANDEAHYSSRLVVGACRGL